MSGSRLHADAILPNIIAEYRRHFNNRATYLGEESSDDKAPRQTRKRANSYDVARLAGVSQSAVSRVFQQGASASEQMRSRVLKAAKKLGYRPNAIARGLITQRSDMVAVLISVQTNLYYPEVLVQLTKRFSERGVRVLLFALEHEGDIESTLEQVLRYRVDGVVTAAMLSPEQLATIESVDIPVVFFNRTLADAPVNSVRCDQEEGERWLVRQLHEAGHRRFAIVTGPDDSPVSTERTRGATRMLHELGVRDFRVVNGDYSYASGRTCLAQLMASAEGAPDAVIAANDAMAIGCIDEARAKFGLRVPEDLSVVGFDGIGPSAFDAYALTTIRQPVARMTDATVSMLLDRIENPDLAPEKRVFSGERRAGRSARLST
jgi:DNA-binding LacI/PurR family transcriptional regulator